MIEKGIQWWASLARREQRLMIGSAGLFIMIAIYLVLFEPAWKGREQAARDLPLLRSQLAQLDALASEARRLMTLPVGNDSPQTMRRAFEASVEAAGLKAYLSQSKLSGDTLDVRFKEVPFTEWVSWIDGALRQTNLRIVEASIQREALVGRVSVQLSLEAPRREDR